MKKKPARAGLCRYCLERETPARKQYCRVCARNFVEGNYQLLRFAGTVRFKCANCGQDKRAGKAWVANSDKGRKICEACYQALIREERERRKRSGGEHPDAMLAGYWKQKQARQQTGSPPAEAAGEAEWNAITSRYPGVSAVLAFFAHAGVPARLLTGAYVQIGDAAPVSLADASPSRMRGWNEVIDRLALKSAAKKFIQAIEGNVVFGPGFRAFLKPEESGFSIMRGGERVAFIRATSARTAAGTVINANFLAPGPHWRQLAVAIPVVEPASALEEEPKRPMADPSQQEAPRPVSNRRFEDLPETIDPIAAAACLDASRRIRTERQVAYDRPVILQSEHGELTLLPITSTGIRLLLPFRLTRGPRSLSGKLELILGDPDPLPLLIDGDAHDGEAVAAWASALLGFADATCFEVEWTPPAVPRPRARSASAQARHTSQAIRSPRRRPWPGNLQPVGQWVQYAGSFVAGHRRTLSEGRSASEDARERARQVGIILRADETWVRPHARGIPDDIEMRFRWHAPQELQQIPRTATL
jgi:hypothetical protein